MKTVTKLLKWLCQSWVISLFCSILITILVIFYGQLLSIGKHKPFASLLYKEIAIGMVWLIFTACYLRIKPIKIPAQTNGDAEILAQASDLVLQQRFVKKFTAIIDELKQTVGKSLPIFLVMGPENSGKKSLLKQASLTLDHAKPMPSDLAQAYVDVYLGENAIFLTIAQCYWGEETTSETQWQWLAKFLSNQLKKKIQGIILTYSMADLLTLTPDISAEPRLQIFRNRIQILQEQLGYYLSIHLLITQADRLCGFKDFFGNLTATEKQKPWGISFPSISEFNQQYDVLLQQLDQRVLPTLQQTTEAMQRIAIVDFPLQMAAIRFKFAHLLKAISQPHPYSAKLNLQNIYWVSTQQQGESIDHIMGSVADKLGLQPNVTQDQSNSMDSYFVQDLFKDVLVAKQTCYTPTQFKFRKQQLLLKISYAFLTLGAFAIGGLWFFSYQNNKIQLQDLSARVKAYQATAQNSQPIWGQLVEVAKLSSAQERNKFLNWLGFSQAEKAATEVNSAYQKQLQRVLLPSILSTLENNLQSAITQSTDVYRPLKAYLMFGYPKHMQANYIQQWLDQFLQSSTQYTDAQIKILNNAIARLLSEPLPAQNLNAQLITQTRKILNDTVPAQGIYNVLQQQPLALQQAAIQVSEDTITGFRQVFGASATNAVIPGVYTVLGYQNAYLPLQQELVQKYTGDNWVLGSNSNNIRSLNSLNQQLRDLYFTDYVANWNNLLGQLHVKEFADLKEATASVKLLAGPLSPIQQIVTLAAANTFIPKTHPKPVDYSLNQSNGIFNAAMGSDFAQLQSLLSADSPSAALAGLQKQLQNLHGYLNNLLIAANVPKANYLAAKALINDDIANPLVTIQQQINQYPQPVSNWLNELVQQVAKVIFAQAQSYLDQQWQQIVYANYQQSIADRYPFANDAQQEATPADTAAFLGPQGVFTQFYTDYLQPFIDDSGDAWALRSFADQSLLIPAENLHVLQQGKNLSQQLFKPNEKAQNLAVSFILTPIDMSANLGEAQLLIEGEPLVYRHDPQLPRAFSWPNDSSRISLQTVDLNGKRSSKTFSGAWALFKWLHECQMQPQSASQYALTCRLDNGQIRYKLQANSVKNPFQQSNEFDSWVLPATLN